MVSDLAATNLQGSRLLTEEVHVNQDEWREMGAECPEGQESGYSRSKCSLHERLFGDGRGLDTEVLRSQFGNDYVCVCVCAKLSLSIPVCSSHAVERDKW